MIELIVIAVAVLLSAIYLVMRALRKTRRRNASACGGNCSCAATKSPVSAKKS